MAYSYKRSITIDHTKCGSADSTDFPVLVSFTDASFKTVGNGGRIQNANGYDINFYSDSALTTPLYYERESYDASTGTLISWVKVPTVSSSADTIIYIGYGDNGISTDQSSASNVWDSNYVGVWHLGTPSSANATDSISSGHNGTLSSISAASGKIHGALSFNATSNSKVDYSAVITPIGAKTISWWMKWTTGGSFALIIANATNGNTTSGFTLLNGTGISIEIQRASAGGKVLTINTGATNYNDGNWHYCSFSWDGTTGANKVVLRVDNNTYTATASQTETNTPSQNLHLGYYDSSFDWTGILDELRISNIQRSNDWALTEYNNQNSPSTFFTLGSETSLAGGSTSDFFQLF